VSTITTVLFPEKESIVTYRIIKIPTSSVTWKNSLAETTYKKDTNISIYIYR